MAGGGGVSPEHVVFVPENPGRLVVECLLVMQRYRR